MDNPAPKKPKRDWWVYVAALLVVLQAATICGAYARLGELSLVLWYLALGLFPPVAVVLIVVAVAWSVWKRPFVQPQRSMGYAGLVLVFLPSHFMRCYPSSHDHAPSQLHFRVPFDGPVTVGWGGGTPELNYHVSSPDQRWAYDLLVTKEGSPNSGSGTNLADYYCYSLPVLAPAAGVVSRVDDGHPESVPGRMDGAPPGGNEVVIQVAPREYLFLCHMQPRSIRVKPGQQIKQGDVIGLAGNSGHTSMPHLHIHLQDTAQDDWGEGIPLEFYHYRVGNRLVQHGIPHGGEQFEIIEHGP